MIKINLASRKQSSINAAEVSVGGGPKPSKLNIDLSAVKDLPLRKAIMPIVVGAVASYMLDGYKADELAKADIALAKIAEERGRLQAEVAKTRGYEELKKAIERDESIIRTKIDTIRLLIADRATPPKLLLSLAQAVPSELWLSEFEIEKGEVTFKGGALGFNQISDFMKSLGENIYFADVELKNSEQVKETSGQEVATFELRAKRRESDGK
jgi:hypothetical protein